MYQVSIVKFLPLLISSNIIDKPIDNNRNYTAVLFAELKLRILVALNDGDGQESLFRRDLRKSTTS